MEHTHFLFKLAAERSALLKAPLEQQVPKELQPPMLKSKKNNAIKDWLGLYSIFIFLFNGDKIAIKSK